MLVGLFGTVLARPVAALNVPNPQDWVCGTQAQVIHPSDAHREVGGVSFVGAYTEAVTGCTRRVEALLTKAMVNGSTGARWGTEGPRDESGMLVTTPVTESKVNPVTGQACFSGAGTSSWWQGDQFGFSASPKAEACFDG
jgi:hypothetical protein